MSDPTRILPDERKLCPLCGGALVESADCHVLCRGCGRKFTHQFLETMTDADWSRYRDFDAELRKRTAEILEETAYRPPSAYRPPAVTVNFDTPSPPEVVAVTAPTEDERREAEEAVGEPVGLYEAREVLAELRVEEPEWDVVL